MDVATFEVIQRGEVIGYATACDVHAHGVAKDMGGVPGADLLDDDDGAECPVCESYRDQGV